MKIHFKKGLHSLSLSENIVMSMKGSEKPHNKKTLLVNAWPNYFQNNLPLNLYLWDIY